MQEPTRTRSKGKGVPTPIGGNLPCGERSGRIRPVRPRGLRTVPLGIARSTRAFDLDKSTPFEFTKGTLEVPRLHVSGLPKRILRQAPLRAMLDGVDDPLHPLLQLYTRGRSRQDV